MQDSGTSGGVRAEDVISRLKDDGDFDRLRVKITRKIKENEELRSNIISLVKQSAALNCPGAERMKPRQLSDAIHQELGDKLMSQISDSVWNVIRSADGMKTEITETVQSVYDRISRPHGENNVKSSFSMNLEPIQNEHENHRHRDATGACGTGGKLSDGEPNEPPGFGLTSPHQRNKNKHMDQPKKSRMHLLNVQDVERHTEENTQLQDILEPDNLYSYAPPGFSCVLKQNRSGDFSDEDPDVPPGFG